jgi:hypothetical protein
LKHKVAPSAKEKDKATLSAFGVATRVPKLSGKHALNTAMPDVCNAFSEEGQNQNSN